MCFWEGPWTGSLRVQVCCVPSAYLTYLEHISADPAFLSVHWAHGDAGAPWLGASPDDHPASAYQLLPVSCPGHTPHLRGVKCATTPGLGCVLWVAAGSFELPSLMWRLEDQARILLCWARRRPRQCVFVNPPLGHLPTETCWLRTASGRESNLQGKGTMSLSCLG